MYKTKQTIKTKILFLWALKVSNALKFENNTETQKMQRHIKPVIQ